MTSDTLQRPSPEQVLRLFLRPRLALPRPARDFLAGGHRLQFDVPGGSIGAVAAGDGPTVVLQHGWEGHASDLAAFAGPLVARGFRVLALDLPAHGASSGDETSIPASAVALRAVARQDGPWFAVVAHSVGAAVLAEALAGGLPLARVALLAAPARYAAYAHHFGLAAGLDPAELPRLFALISAHIGVDIREVSLPARAPSFSQPALFVHSADDRVVPIGDSQASAAAWPGARHLRVDGLGHRRLLQAPEVVRTVVDFVAEGRPG